MIVLNLPRPPSTNELFYNVSEKQKAAALSKGVKLRGRKRTEKYNAWIHEAGWMLKMQRQTPIKGQVRITHEIADEGSADIGNLEKAIGDLLVAHGMIEGDGRRVVREITLRWVADLQGVRTTVQPVGS